LSNIFEVFNTSNFELIMKQLDMTIKLANRFEANDSFKFKLNESNSKLKLSLIKAIKDLHPNHVFEVSNEKSLCCGEFISRFLDTGGGLFTSNYDLLMYWILMRNNIENVSDGFGREYEDGEDFVQDDFEESELTWGKYKSDQNIFYLHGTLPLYDTGVDIIKEVYTSGNYLMDKVKSRIDNGDYPVFITAGDGNDKLIQIRHNPYLTFCYDRLCNIEGSLITYGFNFGEYDSHIIDAINKAAKFHKGRKGKLFSVYIGVYSKEDIKYIESIKDKFKCKITLYDSKSADIWKEID